MIKTTLYVNSISLSKRQNNEIEVGIVNGLINGIHTHEYQVFDLQNSTSNVGLIGVNNQEVFAIQFKFNTNDDYAFAIYLDGVNVSQSSGIHSLNEISEHKRGIYNAHWGKFISRNNPTRKVNYVNRYSQKNGENRLFTFTTAAHSGINEILINDPSLTNRIEIYVWKNEMIDVSDSAFSPPSSSVNSKVGAGEATHEEYKKAENLSNPEFMGKIMFIHTQANNINHLGKALLSLEEIEKLKNDDPMNRVPRT